MNISNNINPTGNKDTYQRAVRHALICAGILDTRVDDEVMIKHWDKLSGSSAQVCYEETSEDQKPEQK